MRALIVASAVVAATAFVGPQGAVAQTYGKGRTMALAFHPELSGDLRLHREFLRLVRS